MLVVGEGSRAESVAEILSSHGHPAAVVSAADLAERDADDDFLFFTELSLAEATRLLKGLGPRGRRPTAIVVCEAIRPGEVRLALAGGVGGVVLSRALTRSLMPTVTAVLCGQVVVPRLEARQVEAASLSTREKQILGMVVMGCMNGEIADRLVVAESTVKSHLSSAFGKLGVRSRNEAVDLLLDSERGLGKGILGLGGEPLETLEPTIGVGRNGDDAG